MKFQPHSANQSERVMTSSPVPPLPTPGKDGAPYDGKGVLVSGVVIPCGGGAA